MSSIKEPHYKSSALDKITLPPGSPSIGKAGDHYDFDDIEIQDIDRVYPKQVDGNRLSKQNGQQFIDHIRRGKMSTKMKPWDGKKPQYNDGNGSMAVIEIDGNPIIGVNSDAMLNKGEDRILGEVWQHAHGDYSGNSASYYHAETHVLARAYKATNGKLPKVMTMYLDRPSCPKCQDKVPELINDLKINHIIIHYANGESFKVTKDGYKIIEK